MVYLLMAIPEIIPMRRMEDLHTEFVGRCADGTQFFLNETFVELDPQFEDWKQSRHEYLVLYLFDFAGHYVRHSWWHGGTTSECNRRELESKRDQMLAELGDVQFCDISVRSFSVKIDDVVFGLIPNTDDETVELEPSSQISFEAPWDGEYYT